MNKQLRKVLSIFAISVITTGAITGCQSKNNTTDENTQTQTEQTTSENTQNEMPQGQRGPGGLVKEEKVDTSSITNKYLDVSYADKSESQKMDIYLPDNIDESEPVPVIVYVHGGAFKMGDKSSGVLKSVLEGVKRGYAVVSVNYRLSEEASFPAAVEDVKAAIRYLRANASKYNLDSEKFAVWGESAGGNIAAMVGTTGDDKTYDDASLGNADESSAVQAVVDWFGPIDFTQADAQMEALGLTPKMGATSSPTSPESQYLGVDLSNPDNNELAQKSNPTNYITKNDPAFLIQHGTCDTNVPITQSENFAKELEKVLGSDKVTFESMEGAAHGDFGDVKAFETESNINRVFEFLDATLKNN